jgi:hypothetical protein
MHGTYTSARLFLAAQCPPSKHTLANSKSLSFARCGRHARVRHRTDRRASRLIVKSLAFGTLGGIDHIREAAHADRRIRTFQLAGATARAHFGDDLVGHGPISNACDRQSVHDCNFSDSAHRICRGHWLGDLRVFTRYLQSAIFQYLLSPPDTLREATARQMPSDCSACTFCRQDNVPHWGFERAALRRRVMTRTRAVVDGNEAASSVA